jgi:hypothetical protein
MYQLASHWTDFNEILYWTLSLKSVEKLQIWLQADNNMVTSGQQNRELHTKTYEWLLLPAT